MECIICARCGAHIHCGYGCDCRWADQIEMELRSSRKLVKGSYSLDSYGKELANIHDDVW